MDEPKINYNDVAIAEMATFGNKKPSLLLHACCGPCSCYPLLFLCPHFQVTIYYANSNIYPSEEYTRRRDELKFALKQFEDEYGYHVDLIIPPYDHEAYMEDLRPFANEPERGKRCLLCYEKRMDESYGYAEEHGFDYFTTVMTISRQKSSLAMNEIGKKLEAKHPKTKYFYSDFKKKNGILIGKEMRERYGLYNQRYCGCEYSLASREAYDAQKAKETNP